MVPIGSHANSPSETLAVLKLLHLKDVEPYGGVGGEKAGPGSALVLHQSIKASLVLVAAVACKRAWLWPMALPNVSSVKVISFMFQIRYLLVSFIWLGV